jgi:hypothetical protein
VQRWHFIVLAGVLVLGIGFAWTHRQQLGLAGARPTGANDTIDSNDAAAANAHLGSIAWQKVDRPADGFRLEMPVNVNQIQIPAYNESGGVDQVNMIFSNPDAETTFSLAWADNPPVARVSGQSPDQMLEMARAGALARTQTAEVNEAVVSSQGFPGRQFASRNSGGGIMDSRLIYAGSRLYMLTAAFPSSAARHEKDVSRFFNSFAMTSTASSGKSRSPSSSRTN